MLSDASNWAIYIHVYTYISGLPWGAVYSLPRHLQTLVGQLGVDRRSLSFLDTIIRGMSLQGYNYCMILLLKLNTILWNKCVRTSVLLCACILVNLVTGEYGSLVSGQLNNIRTDVMCGSQSVIIKMLTGM